MSTSRVVSRILLLGLALSGLSGMAHAGTDNVVPSCYEANKIQRYTAPYDKLVYVLVDQTTNLDPTLRKSVLTNLVRVLQPGTKFVVADFSAFSQGRYFQVLTTGVIEAPIPQEHVGDVVMTRLSSFRTCLKNQRVFARKLAVKAAYEAMGQSTGSLDHSDILMALKTVAPVIANDAAKNKLMLLVSDGLENSSVTTFYARHTVRELDVDAEMAKIRKHGLFDDFGGARVYVLGGANLPAAKRGSRDQRDGYRNPEVLMALKEFWSRYFSAAGGKLVEFGEPALVSPLQF